MGNHYLDTSVLDKAIKFTVDAHKNQERRGRGTPYVIHVLEAVAIVETLTSDQELLAAAALHDVIEDTDVSIADLEREFGPRIARIVDEETSLGPAGLSEQATWYTRKLTAINNLKAANRETKIVAMGDKLSNMRAIYRDYHLIGDKLWERFHVTNPKDHAWHYRGLADALSDLSDTEAYKEFILLMDEIFPEE